MQAIIGAPARPVWKTWAQDERGVEIDRRRCSAAAAIGALAGTRERLRVEVEQMMLYLVGVRAFMTFLLLGDCA